MDPELAELLTNGGMPNRAFDAAGTAGGPQRQQQADQAVQIARMAPQLLSAGEQAAGLPPGTLLKKALLEAIQLVQGARMVPDSALQQQPIAAPMAPRVQP